MPKPSKAVAALKAFPFGSARQLATAVRTEKVTALELLKAYLARVDELNPVLNAVVVDDRERALKDARAADRARRGGARLGPLHGVPVAVKEELDVAGCVTTFGGRGNSTPAAEDGEVVVFSFVEWESREVCDAAHGKMMEDERMKQFMGENPDTKPPFDGKRMVYGGFRPVVELNREPVGA